MSTRFNIYKENFGSQEMVILTDITSKERLKILPESGAMLLSAEFNFNETIVPVTDTYSCEDDLLRNLDKSFKGSNLFPFPNRINNGEYEYKNHLFNLDINFTNENNAIHGLVYHQKFDLIETVANNNKALATFRFISNGDIHGYPFKFEYQVTYELDAKYGLTVKATATNSDKKEIPVGFGFHPYFKLDNKINKLQLEFTAKEEFHVNERMIPTGEKELFKKFNNLKFISDNSFDTCFSLSTVETVAKTRIMSEDLNGGICIWQETGSNKLNYLQIYTPPGRESIAIEPMSCIADAFNNKIGLIELPPEKSASVKWGVCKIV